MSRHYVKDQQLDFRCGPNTYDGHKGTDIALKDLEQMQRRVKVLSPIDGIVEARRNNVDDISVRKQGRSAIKGIECGNGVVISNSDIQVQLCHLKKRSINVKVGSKIKAGSKIGEVGLSGLTEYPHLHISVREKWDGKSRELDPFYGSQPSCGLRPKSIWVDAELMNKHSGTGIVYNYGFAYESLNAEQVRSGEYIKIQPSNPKEFVGFIDMFSVNKGDRLEVSIIDNSGKLFVTRHHKFGKYQARYFFLLGKKLRGQRLLGDYILKIKYTHSNGKIDTYTYKDRLNLKRKLLN